LLHPCCKVWALHSLQEPSWVLPRSNRCRRPRRRARDAERRHTPAAAAGSGTKSHSAVARPNQSATRFWTTTMSTRPASPRTSRVGIALIPSSSPRRRSCRRERWFWFVHLAGSAGILRHAFGAGPARGPKTVTADRTFRSLPLGRTAMFARARSRPTSRT
jgi:hypothetical protein